MAQPQGNQDYLDKAFNAGAKKFGGAQGQKVAGNRALSEKIVRTTSLPSTIYFPTSNFLPTCIFLLPAFCIYLTSSCEVRVRIQ